MFVDDVRQTALQIAPDQADPAVRVRRPGQILVPPYARNFAPLFLL
jgi:hypothetical protein